MAKDSNIWVGMDMHKLSIAICFLRGDSQVEESREIRNEPAEIHKLFKKLKKEGTIRACYEAGGCGYTVRRQLEKMGISCEVIAPSMIPRRPGDKVKTDSRDARKIARLYRAGELTTIHVPAEAEEAARDLLRCREDLGEDLNRQRHRLLKFFLRHGRIWKQTENWTVAHWKWLREQKFDLLAAQRTFEEYLAQLDHSLARMKALDREIEALAKQEPYRQAVDRLKCLKGFGTLAAMILVTEIQDFRRFASPRELMNFVGLTPGVHASGGKGHGLSITKSGNGHVRRVVVEAAWNYTRRPQLPSVIKKRCNGQPDVIVAEAREAQERLNFRYRHLRQKGKKPTVAVTAVARELLGFVWAVMLKDVPLRVLEEQASRKHGSQ